MIQVLGLSPAVDVTYFLDRVELGSQHRVERVERRAGGKAGNVARVLHTLGSSPRLICPLGGQSGQWYASEMSSLGIDLHAIDTDSETRRCHTIVETDRVSEFNEAAPGLGRAELHAIAEAIQPAEVSILSGSVPTGIDDAELLRLFTQLREASGTVIVDTSGHALSLAVGIANYIAPNQREWMELEQSRGPLEWPSQTTALRTLAEGGLLVPGAPAVMWRAPTQVGNPTGAGDALVAGFADALSRGEPDPGAFAVAVSAASVRQDTAGDVQPGDIAVIRPLVERVVSTD